MENVYKLGRRGTLKLEEPIDVSSPVQHFPKIGVLEEPAARSGPLNMLLYEVLLHLDKVIDFTDPPDSSPDCHTSFHSDVSGQPLKVSLSEDWPRQWHYR